MRVLRSRRLGWHGKAAFHIIDMLFGARRPMTTAEIKERLQARGVIDEMTDKNIRRDLEFLRRFGYALQKSLVKGDRGAPRQAWAIKPGRGAVELVAPAISLPELLSLAAARDFLAPLAGTMYWRGIGQVLAKMEAVATPDLIEYAASLRDGLVVHPSPKQGKYRPQLLNAINRAISGSVVIELDYASRSRSQPRRYLVEPEALVVYDGSIYIAGYRADFRKSDNPRSQAVQFFKIDRVSRAKPTSRCFARRPELVSSLLSDSMTLFRSASPPRKYRIRIDPDRAKWAIEKPFHPGQKVRALEDGSVLLDIDRAWDEEMVPQLLALGDRVEVLQPEDVRTRLAEEAAAIVARYQRKSVRREPRKRPVPK